jgi:hypothetical protein
MDPAPGSTPSNSLRGGDESLESPRTAEGSLSSATEPSITTSSVNSINPTSTTLRQSSLPVPMDGPITQTPPASIMYTNGAPQVINAGHFIMPQSLFPMGGLELTNPFFNSSMFPQQAVSTYSNATNALNNTVAALREQQMMQQQFFMAALNQWQHHQFSSMTGMNLNGGQQYGMPLSENSGGVSPLDGTSMNSNLMAPIKVGPMQVPIGMEPFVNYAAASSESTVKSKYSTSSKRKASSSTKREGGGGSSESKKSGVAEEKNSSAITALLELKDSDRKSSFSNSDDAPSSSLTDGEAVVSDDGEGGGGAGGVGLQQQRSRVDDNVAWKKKVIHNNNVYRCTFPSCDYQTSHKANVRTHIRVHTKERPFKCRYAGCTFTSSQVGNRNMHERIHTGLKPHACNYPNCNYTSAKGSNLKAHKARIHGEVSHSHSGVSSIPAGGYDAGGFDKVADDDEDYDEERGR